MKIISLNYKMMHTPDRDQQPARKTLQEIKNFEQRYPDSDFLPIVRQIKVSVEDNLAQGDYGIGLFYKEKRDNPLGARLRFQGITEQYPNYSEMDAVLFQLGEIGQKFNNPEEAAQNYNKLIQGYPFSKFYDEAKTRLIAMGKEIPMVDKELAAANLSRLKPDRGFSPLQPIVDFGKALGFVGAPDQYQLAKRNVEEGKTKEAKAGASGSEEGSSVQIDAVITKSVSGADQEAATNSANSTNPPENSDDKKNSRYKRKNNKNP
jgi:tetratricopeptide (TPR) repeat protein